MKIAEDTRPLYAARIRELADLVEKHANQPLAARIFVFFDDGSATCANRTEEGANFMTIAGALLARANEDAYYGNETAREITKEPPPPTNLEEN